jgi:phosphoenolpyruvate carboxykinase (GTP)
LPRIFCVNWFRKSAGGDFLWPGYGENGRVLKWIFERCTGSAKAVETPIGNLPTTDAIDVSGLDLDKDELADLLAVELDGWLAEIDGIREYYDTFEGRVPQALWNELEALKTRLEAAKS